MTPSMTPTLAPALDAEPTSQSAILEMPAEPEMSTVTEEPVAIITQPSPKLEAKAPRLVRLIPTHGFPIRHFNGGIVFYPNQPSAEVPVDAWLENQMRRGILREV
jgi:hypothetical protein